MHLLSPAAVAQADAAARRPRHRSEVEAAKYSAVGEQFASRTDLAYGFGCGEAGSRASSILSLEPLVINGPAAAADLPRMENIAVGPDGGVWLGSLVGLRRLDPQPDGTYSISTVPTRAFGRQQDVVWGVSPDVLTDIAPLQDGRVLVLTRTSLLVLGADGVLRGTDRRDHRWIAVRDGGLLSVGPVPTAATACGSARSRRKFPRLPGPLSPDVADEPLREADDRHRCVRGGGPGRTPGGDYELQRD